MNKPQFITFTGVDAYTSFQGMRELAAQYPVEFGVLFSPGRQGRETRYPPPSAILELCQSTGVVPLAAHLCGEDARGVIEFGNSTWDGLIEERFARAQINTAQTVNVGAIKEWADGLAVRAILQCRSFFPFDRRVDYPFDQSGGRGNVPKFWPASPDPSQFCGYAGGLNPDNIAKYVAALAPTAGKYWLDMETGVRDENDRFDLSKCRAVCEAVFGT